VGKSTEKENVAGLRIFDHYRFLIGKIEKKFFFDFLTIFLYVLVYLLGLGRNHREPLPMVEISLKNTFRGGFGRFWLGFSRFLADQKSVARATLF